MNEWQLIVLVHKVRVASQEIIRWHQASGSSACSVRFLPPHITGLRVFSYYSLPACNLTVSLCRVWVIVWNLNSWLSVVYGACLYWSQGPYTLWDSSLKRILTSNLTKSRLLITYYSVTQSFLICAQSMAVSLLWARLQNDWTTETDVMDEKDFARFDFKMSFGRISFTAQPPFLTGQFRTKLWQSVTGRVISLI